MWTVGHSRGVARLAEQAAVVAGLDPSDVVLVRRAALVHDIGRVAVPVSVWTKPGRAHLPPAAFTGPRDRRARTSGRPCGERGERSAAKCARLTDPD
ncbi:MAG: HD domain-containing protein [Actinomycetota bacterium]|nr:HD domain-containing protein [Actinomycetota bacterium]